jgi:hypothetical protein
MKTEKRINLGLVFPSTKPTVGCYKGVKETKIPKISSKTHKIKEYGKNR